MSIVKTDSQHYTDIASAIREKNGETTLYKPSEMAAAILAIKAGADMPAFSYTGAYTILNDGDGNWRIRFLTSGTLTLNDPATIDAFLVGGGASGSISGGSSYMGGGGGSGFTTTQKGIYLEAGIDYSIVIGAGGTSPTSSSLIGNSGGTTSAFNLSAAGGTAGNGTYYTYGGSGGSGGGSGGSSSQKGDGGTDGGNGAGTYPGTGQGTTTREFGETGGALYAAGGKGGVATGSLFDADANSGDGGDGSETKNQASGAGGSGIVVIRNAREVTT